MSSPWADFGDGDVRLRSSPVSNNVELVRRSFEAISAWNIEALLRLYHPEIEFMPLTGTQVETGGYRGHDGVRAYLEEAEDLWEVLEPDGNQYDDLGDRVVVSGNVPGPRAGERRGVPSLLCVGHRRARRPDRLPHDLLDPRGGGEAGRCRAGRGRSALSPDAEEPAALARRLVDSSSYLTLGTADADGRPWVSPVWYAPASYKELLWVSSPDARHSRHLAARPEAGIVIFDSRAALGEAQAVYMTAVAKAAHWLRARALH